MDAELRLWPHEVATVAACQPETKVYLFQIDSELLSVGIYHGDALVQELFVRDGKIVPAPPESEREKAVWFMPAGQ